MSGRSIVVRLGGLKNEDVLKPYKVAHFRPFDPVHMWTEVNGADDASFKVNGGAPQITLDLTGRPRGENGRDQGGQMRYLRISAMPNMRMSAGHVENADSEGCDYNPLVVHHT